MESLQTFIYNSQYTLIYAHLWSHNFQQMVQYNKVTSHLSSEVPSRLLLDSTHILKLSCWKVQMYMINEDNFVGAQVSVVILVHAQPSYLCVWGRVTELSQTQVTLVQVRVTDFKFVAQHKYLSLPYYGVN